MADTTGGTGTHAAGTVQDEQKNKLTENDIRRETRTITRQLIEPMCRYRFTSQFVAGDFPLPTFRRVRPEILDRSLEADVMIKGQQLGMEISKAWAHERLGIPELKEGEEILTPELGTFGDQLQEGM